VGPHTVRHVAPLRIGRPGDLLVLAPDLSPAQVAGLLLDRRAHQRRRTRTAHRLAAATAAATGAATYPLAALSGAGAPWPAVIIATVAAVCAALVAGAVARRDPWTPPAHMAVPLPRDEEHLAAGPGPGASARTHRDWHAHLWHLACLRSCQRALDTALERPDGPDGPTAVRMLLMRADLDDAVATTRARLAQLSAGRRGASAEPVPVTWEPVRGRARGVVDAIVED